MIGLVLVTHGRLAAEFLAAMEHVVGPQPQIRAVCIGADDDIEQRRGEIVDAIRAVDDGSGVVVLTDMFGGTPSNLAISTMDRQGHRGDRRRQPADADQARQRAPDRAAARGGDARPRRPGASTSTSRASCSNGDKG